jgi:glycosyltransferase involved in cell wall biosynthesis
MSAGVSVVFVSPNAFPVIANNCQGHFGGAELQQVMLARGLAQRGCRVTVLTDMAAGEMEHHGVRVVRCPFRYFGGPGWTYWPDTVALLAVLKKTAPDVLVLKGPRALLFSLGLYRRLFGGRLVKIVAEVADFAPRQAGFLPLLYSAGLRWMDVMVFQTEQQRQLARRQRGLDGVVIRSMAHRRPAGLDPEASKESDVLWIGSCYRVKQPDRFLELTALLPDVSFEMIMAGCTETAWREELTARAQSRPNVRFSGPRPYEEVFVRLSRARLIASTSSNEGFPNVFLQAWQLGIPVVSLSADPGGIVSENGLGLVAGGSLPKMAGQIRELLRDEDQRLAMGRRAAEYVKREHDPDEVVGRYLDLFAGLMGRPQSPR